MGCLEKVFGSLLGIALLVYGIVALINGELEEPDAVFMIISSGLFALLNLITSYESFQSVLESFTQSVFSAVIGKWVVLAGISLGIGYVICGLIFGFDFL